jgi:hypothetical protein
LFRVFGFDRRTQKLIDDLGKYWRYIGPIQLIGGRDSAYATVEPHEFFEFLSGRLVRTFIKDRRDLVARSEAIAAVPDPDGRYRVEDFLCHEDTWRMTVTRLTGEADAVLMDLRGFGGTNTGIVFEIEQMLACIPLHQIVVLADRATDFSLLERTLRVSWDSLPIDSPNVGAGEHRLRVLLAGNSDRANLAAVLGLFTVHARNEEVPPLGRSTNSTSAATSVNADPGS